MIDWIFERRIERVFEFVTDLFFKRLRESNMEEKWSIDKLNGSNWNTWKFQMKHLLLAKGLWDLVDGSEVLADDATTTVQAIFRSRLQKAFSTIALAIDSAQLYLITSSEEPKQAWDALRKHFERETLANKLFLKKQYFRSEMKGGTSVEQHLKHMEDITDKLAAIGAPISEEDQVMTLLGSLPRSFATLVTAIEARMDGVSLDYVQQPLIHEEMKQSELSGQLLEAESALTGAFGRDTPRDQPTCFRCGTVGHVRRDCSRNQPTCFGCGDVGHVRRYCPKKFKWHKAKMAESDERRPKNSDFEGEDVYAAAFVASLESVESAEKKCSPWVIDSGASSHMTKEKHVMVNFQEFDKPENVALGDGRVVKALGSGSVRMNMLFEATESKKAVLYDVLYVPKLTWNLFSVRAAVAKGNAVEFGPRKCCIWDENGKLRGMGSLADKLYQLDCQVVPTADTGYASVASSQGSDLWHQRLGHVHEPRLKKCVESESVRGIDIKKMTELSFCEGCLAGKMCRKPFPAVGEIRSTRRLKLVHSDVCGPMHTPSIGGAKYFVTFIDDYTRCCAVYFMKHKSEVFDKFIEFEASVTNDVCKAIGTLRTDNGGEYLSTELQNYLKKKGIRHELTVPHSPQQNGVAERMNRTLVESARSMIAHAALPNIFWAEAISTAAYVRNRLPTTALKENETPYERWYGRKPDVSHLRVFGCMAYAHVPDSERRKLDKKSKKMRFVGYSLASKGYHLLDETNRKMYIRRDVEFNENDFGQKQTMTTEPDPRCEEAKRNEVPPRKDEEGEQGEMKKLEEDTPEEPRQSVRTRKAPVRYGYDEYADTATHHVHHVAYHLSEIDEPTTMQEARSSDHAAEWKVATDSEYNSLIENKTWELVELPPGRKADGCKWVFKLKHAGDGTVERFKARLVAKGYAQKCGIDYDETFSPVVRFSSIRFLLAFAVQNDLLIHQMDVETAFLNGKLDEEIYMQQPEGYVKPGEEHLVCKLEKYRQTEAKPVSTPADLNVKLQKEDCFSRPVDATSYQSMVGSLLYAAIATRPDIAQAVGVVSKFCANPTQNHLTAAKRILRYLKATAYLGLSYKKCADGNLIGYSDADWAGDIDDCHSTSGNVFSFACGAVSWLSKKQATVSLSTAEAEYVALSTATQEAIWLRRLLADVGEPPEGPTEIYEDNQGAVSMAKNPVGHARTKHIDIRYHFVREGVQDGAIALKYIATDEMIADILTKPLPKHGFQKLVTELGMKTVK